MISKEIQQALRQKYNPEGSLLRTVQKGLLDILVEFDRICRKNSIPYWLDSGTLIGAARHGGFIPWDDDLDVCILRSDLKRLEKAMRNELSAPFSYEGKMRSWVKIINRSVTITRVVPKTGAPDEKTLRKDNIWLDVFVEINGSVKASRAINGFYGHCFRRRYKVIDDGALRHIVGSCLFPVARFMAFTVRLSGRLFHPDTLIHDIGTGFYSQRKTDEIFPLTEIEFEGQMFPAPAKTPEYLERIYGDWNSIPRNIENHNIADITTN